MDDRIDEESDAEFAAEKLESMYNTALFSFDIKKLAGFGKDGEKGFEGTMTQLQMQTYLCACDFRKRVNKRGRNTAGMWLCIPCRRSCGDMIM